MAELKTKETSASVEVFLNSIENEAKRKDAFTLLGMMKQITNFEPKMWGSSIIGFGNYHYKYASGQEGDWFILGFSPRKTSLSVYLMFGDNKPEDLFAKLGKHKTGVGCIYINKLADVNLNVLEGLIKLKFENCKI